MIELLALLIIISVSLVLVRAGAIALEKTGLSRQSAQFQSQSAFMLVGFTTKESEHVINHPVRRRVVRGLMLLGFGASTGMLGTFVVAFARGTDGDWTPGQKMILLSCGLGLIWIVYKLEPFERVLEGSIRRALAKSTKLRILDFEEMLKLNKGYTIANLHVEENSWTVNRTLHQLELPHEGILVLSITRENAVVLGTPAPTSRLHQGDRILCYGLDEDLGRLRNRSYGPEGDEQHQIAKKPQRLRLVAERVEDEIAESELAESESTETEQARSSSA